MCKNFIFLFFFSSLIACTNFNKKKVSSISELEKITQYDIQNLQKIKIYDLDNALKIAKLNLAKLEKKKMDSINVELIYFEYRNYLNCINIIYENTREIDNLNHTLSNNANQLKDLKHDYINSRTERIDLDKYFFEEMKIVKETSKKVNTALKTTKKEVNRFNNLNEKIEQFIN